MPKPVKRQRSYRRIRRALALFLNNSIVRIQIGILTVVTIGGLSVVFFENNSPLGFYKHIFDGFWWAFVTITTVGYGDAYPVSLGGRLTAIAVMMTGIGVISTLTATISSAFIESRLRKGQGLEKVKLKKHIVICGWNFNVEEIIRTLEAELDFPSIVLVNSCDPSPIGDIINRHKDSEISFVAGDFSKDDVLDKASIRHAECVIIVADSNELSANKADEKTIITALTVKNMNPKVRLYAHIINPDNASHLRRAKADDVVVSDKYSGFLLAMHVTNPGVPRVVDELLSLSYGNEIIRLPIPDDLVGKTFWQLTEYFKDKHDAILFGLAHESQKMGLTDLLSDDDSYLDRFIRQKLQESGKKFAEEERMAISINPPKERVIQKDDVALVIMDKF